MIATASLAAGPGPTASAVQPGPLASAAAASDVASAAVVPTQASVATARVQEVQFHPEAPHPTASVREGDNVARLLAGLGLLVSLGKVIWDYHAKNRDRRLSIEDDFWFRKVVTPTAIEPMLRTLADTLSALPTEATPEAERKTFALKVTTDFQQLYAKLPLLGFIDSSLVAEVQEAVQACEDILSEHVGALDTGGPGASTTPSRAWDAMNKALRTIREHQLARVR